MTAAPASDETLGDIAVDGIEADVDIDVSGFDLMLVGTLPIGDTFYGFAKAGVLFWDVEADVVIREDDGEGGVITTTDQRRRHRRRPGLRRSASA